MENELEVLQQRKRTVSVVVPVYFNAPSLPLLFERLCKVEDTLKTKGLDLELVFVDDGSGDDSLRELLKIREKKEAVKVIKLIRNFGAVAAIKTGVRMMTGDCFVILAADLQSPPELICDMVDKWLAGAKYVACIRKKRKDPLFSNIFSWLYYKIVKYFIMADYPQGGSDYSLMDRELQPYYCDCGKNVFTPIYIYWLGFIPEYIEYNREKRIHGKSRWTIGKKITAFLDTFLGFSIIPIRVMSGVGAFVSFASVTYGVIVVIEALLGATPVKGFSALASLISFLLGTIILMLGIIGEYIWRIFDEVGKRPEVVIDKVY